MTGWPHESDLTTANSNPNMLGNTTLFTTAANGLNQVSATTVVRVMPHNGQPDHVQTHLFLPLVQR